MKQGKGNINYGTTEIVINYEGIEESRKKFDTICTRISSLLMNELNMQESQGEMADALKAQYKYLQDVLRQMGQLTENINSAVEQATQKFQDMDEGIASSIGE